jgi:hypothetical protein
MTLIPAPRGSFPPGLRGKLRALRAHTPALGDVRGNRAVLVERRNRVRKTRSCGRATFRREQTFLAGPLPGCLRLPPTYKGAGGSSCRSGSQTRWRIRCGGSRRRRRAKPQARSGRRAPTEPIGCRRRRQDPRHSTKYPQRPAGHRWQIGLRLRPEAALELPDEALELGRAVGENRTKRDPAARAMPCRVRSLDGAPGERNRRFRSGANGRGGGSRAKARGLRANAQLLDPPPSPVSQLNTSGSPHGAATRHLGERTER